METEKEIICQCSSNNEWAIALFSSVIGILTGGVLVEIRRSIENRKIIKAMTKSLFIEIASLRRRENKELPETKSILNEFQEMYQLQNFTYSPAVIYLGQPERDYYDLYQSDIHFLEQSLKNDVVVFYSYMRSINDGSKKIDDMFKKFYKHDKTIGGQDIVKFVNKLIKQMEIIDILGAEILAQLVVQYRVDKLKESKENKQKKKDIQSYLKNNLRINDVVDVQIMAQEKKIDLIWLIIILLKTKRFIKIKYGLYKKIK